MTEDNEAKALVERLRREVWPDLTDDEILTRLQGLAEYLQAWEDKKR